MMMIRSLILSFYLLIYCFQSSFSQTIEYNNGNSDPLETFQNARLYIMHMTGGGRQFTLGAKGGVVLEIGPKGHSGFRFYISGGLAKNFSQGTFETILNYQADLVLYSNGLGSSILPSERSKINIELRNHVGFNVGGNDSDSKVWARPLNPNIGDANSILDDPLDYSFQIGTVFVTGLSHKRSQQIGFFKAGVAWFHLFYMNDGPPFGMFGLGDTWDRYWTGVGGIGFHQITPTSEITSMELRYNRYTGDEPFLYDLSSELRMNYLPHKNKTTQFFNKGRYQYRIGFRNAGFVGINIYQPKITDVQRIIHHGIWAFHTNPTSRYFTVFGQFTYKNTYLSN